jgi:nitrous oxide reductase
MTALALLVVAVAACGNGDETSVAPERRDRPVMSPPASSTTTGSASDEYGHRVEITVTDGEPEGGVRTESVDLDEQVVLVIISDTSDEVHVHGYDLTVVVVPGEPATLTFRADKPGVWEVELHEAGNVLLELQVS